MPVEYADPDVPLPTSPIIESILPQHREIVTEVIKNYGERLDANKALFPQGTIKWFIWPRILDWRYLIIFVTIHQSATLIATNRLLEACTMMHLPAFRQYKTTSDRKIAPFQVEKGAIKSLTTIVTAKAHFE